MAIIKITATDGSPVEFVDTIIGSGGMKDVYFSPDKSYVVAFFRDRQDANAKDRLQNITGKYREGIFNQVGGDYWTDLYCWPTKIVGHDGKLGLVCPTYRKDFFFSTGSANNDHLQIKGRERNGKWFASSMHQNRSLAPEEKGNWFNYFQICIAISRAVRRLHAAGLAHSDLSFNNVLVAPTLGKACIIDIDGLVVPNKFPPDVLGTKEFIAPEVYATKQLKMSDPNMKLPCIATDKHALAVMIYFYLLYRDPLDGRKVWDITDNNKDEELRRGINAIFIENANNTTNSVRVSDLRPSQLPQGDPGKIPYSVCGPHLKKLFDKAFIDGLHNPALRPIAGEWEQALLKTVDLIQPCQNPNCWHKWFVFDNTTKPKCPFCGTEYRGQLPVLNLYSSPRAGVFKPDNYRVMVYHNQYLYPWHVNKYVAPNEKLTPEQRNPVGYFAFHKNKWLFINQRLNDLEDKTEDKKIPIGQAVELTDGKRILLSREDGGRLIIVQLVNN
jgi:serine/threonine protein kinase